MKNVVPTNWLDPLLSGKDAVVTIGKPLTCPDVERLLLAVKARQRKAILTLLRAERAAWRRVIKRAEGYWETQDGLELFKGGCWINRDDLLAALRGKK